MATLDHKTDLSQIRREILRNCDRLPALPDVVVKVISLLSDPETEPEDLAAHLQNDHVLVAKMLAMVNSTYYGLNREIMTIRDAVMVLGFRGLRTLTIATATVKFLELEYGCYGHTNKGLWSHSLVVAAAAEDLAKSTAQTSVLREEIFVAGLLHDIGKMLLASKMRDQDLKPDGPGHLRAQLERDALGIDHGEAGALVCAKWNLSELVQEVLVHHHDQDCPKELEVPCAILRLADALAHERGIGYRPEQAPDSDFRSEDLQILKLEPSSWERARSSAEAAMDLALQSFQKLLG